MTVLDSLLEYSVHHKVACLLTVLGERGVGKTRFMAQFERRAARDFDEVRVVRPRALTGGPDAAGMAAALLDAWESPRSAPALGTPEHRLSELAHDVASCEIDRARLLRLLSASASSTRRDRSADVLAAWRELIERTARRQPMVLCLDDLHLADDAVLDWVEALASATGGTALLVVACGHPDLLRRRPFWGSGRPHSGTLTLPRLLEPVPEPRRAATATGAVPRWAADRPHGGDGVVPVRMAASGEVCQDRQSMR